MEISGDAVLILKIRGAKEKYFQGAEDFFRGFEEINALFSRIKGAQTPPPSGPLSGTNLATFCLGDALVWGGGHNERDITLRVIERSLSDTRLRSSASTSWKKRKVFSKFELNKLGI